MTSIQELFAKYHLYHLYQPICYVPGEQRLGHEALIRSESGVYPNELFQQAMRQNQLFELDTMSIWTTVSAYFHSPAAEQSNHLLFVNIFPSTLASERFPSFVDKVAAQFSRFTKRIVFEINESVVDGAAWDREPFLRHVDLVRQQGFLIALDDVEEGMSTLKKAVQLAPDFLKLDKFFSAELSSSSQKQKAVRLFVEYCKGACNLILEGIEKEDDLRKASALGVRFAQGYLLGKPGLLQECWEECVLSNREPN